MNNDNAIHIAVSASREYLEYVPAFIYSACHSGCKMPFVFHVYHLQGQEIQGIQEIYQQFVGGLGCDMSITFHAVDPGLFSDIDTSKGWKLDLWARWYCLNDLHQITDRVLIMGLDTMIRGSISPFYFQNLGAHLFAACPDTWVSEAYARQLNLDWPGLDDMRRFHFPSVADYINGDVVLVNLKEAQGFLSLERFVSISCTLDSSCWDQDVINYRFHDRTQKCDNYLYNYFPNLNIPGLSDKLLYPNTRIVHFAGGPKPWNVGSKDAHHYFGIPEWHANYLAAKEIIRKILNYASR